METSVNDVLIALIVMFGFIMWCGMIMGVFTNLMKSYWKGKKEVEEIKNARKED